MEKIDECISKVLGSSDAFKDLIMVPVITLIMALIHGGDLLELHVSFFVLYNYYTLSTKPIQS